MMAGLSLLTATSPTKLAATLTSAHKRRNFVVSKATRVHMSEFFARKICRTISDSREWTKFLAGETNSIGSDGSSLTPGNIVYISILIRLKRGYR